MNIKIDPLDTLCSKIVRLRANRVCQIGGERKEYNRLMACHCFGRGNKKVRYDLDNMVAGCLGHHQQMDADPEMKIGVFTKQLGLLGYRDLKSKHRILSCKPTIGSNTKPPSNCSSTSGRPSITKPKLVAAS